MPKLRFDCGKDDFLIESNRGFAKHLGTLGVDHQFEEFEGDHNWGYWDEHVREGIEFHLANLGIARTS